MNHQIFLTELVALCRKHNVTIGGSFAVWPGNAADESDPEGAILFDVGGVAPEGLYVGSRSARHKPRPWSEADTKAYDEGYADGLIGPGQYPWEHGADAAYWQGWTHGIEERWRMEDKKGK